MGDGLMKQAVSIFETPIFWYPDSLYWLHKKVDSTSIMGKIEKFEQLECWKSARELTTKIYSLQGKMEKDFGLRDQIRRASVSIMNNIAEGFGRFSLKEKIRYFEIAQSSANEVKSMLYLAEDLAYSEQQLITELHQKVDICQKQIWGLIKYLRQRNY